MLQTKDIEEFRSQLINNLIVFIALASIIEVVLLLTQIPRLGWLPYFIFRFTVVIGLWLLFLFRHRLSYLARVGCVMGGAWLSIIAHLIQFGPAMNAKSAVITLTFFAMLFISERAGWWTLGMIIVIFGALGIAVTQEYLVYQFDYHEHITQPQTWLGTIFGLTAYSAITGYVAMKFLQFLQGLLAQSRNQVQALREANNQIEAANRAKQEFLANMSHELNTPLHNILGYLQMLEDSGLSLQQRGHLATIQQSSEHLHALVNAILDTASLERQRLVLNPTPCGLLELLNHLVNMIKMKAHAKGLNFEVNLPNYLPAEIMVDHLRLRQILLNLLTNAVKYTPLGYVKLQLIVVERTEQDAVLQFQVLDSGIGIPPESRDRLLLPFERGATLGESGAGLGLSIVKQLLQQMDSQLHITSSTSGSCVAFQLQLPVLRWAESGELPSLIPLSSIAPPLKKLQIYWRDTLLGRFPALKQQLESLIQKDQHVLFANQALNLINSGHKAQLQTFLRQFFPVDTPLTQLTDLTVTADPTRPQLLIIDDDDFNIHLVAHYLRDFNFDILSAANGTEGFYLARRVKPQLILLDIYMSGMSGFETCHRLKAAEETQAIPVIFFSASNKPEDIAAAFAHQGQDYILKPAREEEVIARIIAHLSPQILKKPLVNRLTACAIRSNLKDELPNDNNDEVAKTTVEKLYQVRDMLLKDLRQNPALEDLAQTVGLNRNKLNDEFRLLFGDTLFVWLREQRLQQARHLLDNQTELPIQIISEMSGYASVAHFSRAFKQRFGLSPREYRQSLAGYHP